MKTFTQKEIDSLIEELKTEIPSLLKSEGKVVSAGDGSGKISLGKEESAQEASLSKEGSSPEAGPESSPVAAGAESSPAADDAPPASEPAQSPSESQDPSQQEMPQGDEQTLEQAYGSLPEEELRAHYEALKAVLMQRMGGQDQAGSPSAPPAAGPVSPPAGPSAPPAGPGEGGSPAVPPTGPSEVPPGAMKAEGSFGELSKAESRIEELEKNLAGVTKILEMVITKPQGKAVTSMAQFIAKSEADLPATPKLSRQEAMKQLNKVSMDPTLKKSDRELITKFTLNQAVDVKEIQHLLK